MRWEPLRFVRSLGMTKANEQCALANLACYSNTGTTNFKFQILAEHVK